MKTKTTITAVQRRNNRMHAIFETAREQDKAKKKLPLEYAAGSIGNAQRGCVAMLARGAWGYDDETGNLLAAAPELLAALETALRHMEIEHGERANDFEAITGARAAIAKARGGK